MLVNELAQVLLERIEQGEKPSADEAQKLVRAIQRAIQQQEALMATLEKEAYSPEQVGQILGRPPGTIRRWLRTGEIKATKIGRSWVIPKREVERILSGTKSGTK